MRYGRIRANGWVEAEGDYDEPARNGIEVSDHDAMETGLLWPDGEPFVRLPNPIGFGRDDEW